MTAAEAQWVALMSSLGLLALNIIAQVIGNSRNNNQRYEHLRSMIDAKFEALRTMMEAHSSRDSEEFTTVRREMSEKIHGWGDRIHADINSLEARIDRFGSRIDAAISGRKSADDESR